MWRIRVPTSISEQDRCELSQPIIRTITIIRSHPQIAPSSFRTAGGGRTDWCKNSLQPPSPKVGSKMIVLEEEEEANLL